MNKVNITKALAVANKVCGGGQLDKDVVRAYLQLLEGYDDNQILAALDRCMRECKGSLAARDIIQRIADGWPNPQEAWSICPRSEAETVVWTDEISYAYMSVHGMVDRVAARMAFLEVYSQRLQAARVSGKAPRWSVSMGSDTSARTGAVRAAVERGRLSESEGRALCPELGQGTPQADHLLEGVISEVVEAASLDEDNLDDETRAALERLRK